MTGRLSVRKIKSKLDFNTFLKFPWELYKGDPYWVPPLVSQLRRKLDKKKNPAWQYMEGEYFIAWRDQQPVGIIAAFINHRHNEYHDENIGFFGMFEVYDDQEAANALLDVASDFVAGYGSQAIRGPANFTTNDECGVLVKGFDDVPVMVMSYNPPYYQRLLENAPGFRPSVNLYSYNFTLQNWLGSKKLEQTLRIVERNNQRRQITVRASGSARRLKRDLRILKSIYNSGWDNNWGFVPLSEPELDHMVNSMARSMDPRLAIFAEVRGQPVGFLLAFPDLNQPLRRAYAHPGKPDFVSMLQMYWHWKFRHRISRLRIPLMGVEAEYRGIGVEAAMFIALFDEVVKLADSTPWQYADAGWVLETNEQMLRLLERYQGEEYKQYRFYERLL